MFAWLISCTFLANEQYFSLTTNQSTVLSVIAYQPSEHGINLCLLKKKRDENCDQCMVESGEAISTNNTQNTRHIRPLGSATGKRFNTYSASSPTIRPKRESFLQMGFQERRSSYLGCASQTTQNRSPV